MLELNKIYLGNNIDILRTFPDNSIDSIVTDPPYGLGKEPNAVEVLQSWITTGYHEISGKGFMGKEWDSFVPQPIFWKECYRVLKHGGHLLSFAGTRTYDWMVMGIRLSGFEIRDQIAWLYGSGFPKSHNIGVAIDKINGVESKVISNGKSGKSSHAFQSEEVTTAGEYEIKEAQNEWQGWGTALKPALEPIVMARKPLDGTVANNVLKHGVGGINIDGCRVETDDDIGARYDGSFQEGNSQFVSQTATKSGKRVLIDKPEANSLGRFPANVIHDGSDEVVSLFPNTDGSKASGYNFELSNNNNTTNILTNIKSGIHYDDNGGSASRFFYTAKSSQNERNFGLGEFDEKYTASAEFRPNHMEKALDGESGNPFGRWQPKKNIHPTVKPIDLMRYLVRLVTPKGGICLDPFMGSGTTAVACKAEKINYVGCELEPEYVKIAEARIKAEVVMFDIFDFGA